MCAKQHLRAPDRALDADAEHPVEHFVGDFLDRFVTQQHRVVDHRIDAAALARKSGRGFRERARDPRHPSRTRRPCRRPSRIRQRQRHCNCRASTSTSPTVAPQLASFSATERPSPRPGAGDEHRQIAEIVLNGHAAVYFSASFHAAPSRTIQPEVGSQK